MPPSAICGHDPTGTFPDGRIGCGQPIETCAEVYRCTDCTVPFHRRCAEGHFSKGQRACNVAALVYQITLAQDRVGFNGEHDPKLQPAFIPIAEKFLNRWRVLVADDPHAASGPLASLLADVAHEARKAAT